MNSKSISETLNTFAFDVATFWALDSRKIQRLVLVTLTTRFWKATTKCKNHPSIKLNKLSFKIFSNISFHNVREFDIDKNHELK